MVDRTYIEKGKHKKEAFLWTPDGKTKQERHQRQKRSCHHLIFLGVGPKRWHRIGPAEELLWMPYASLGTKRTDDDDFIRIE